VPSLKDLGPTRRLQAHRIDPARKCNKQTSTYVREPPRCHTARWRQPAAEGCDGDRPGSGPRDEKGRFIRPDNVKDGLWRLQYLAGRTYAFGVAMTTLAAPASATAQVQQASPQQASPRQATPLANIPAISSTGTAGTSFRVQGQPQNDVNGITGTAAPSTVGPGIITVNPSGSSTGVQSGSTGSVGNVLRAPLLAPLRTERPAIRVR